MLLCGFITATPLCRRLGKAVLCSVYVSVQLCPNHTVYTIEAMATLGPSAVVCQASSRWLIFDQLCLFLLLFSSFGGIYLGTCVFLSSKTFFFLFSGFSLFHSLISGYPGVSNWNLKKKKCVLFCHLHHFCLFWFTFNVVFFIALGFPVEVLKV